MPPLIVLLFFLLKVLHCSGVFDSSFFCDPVVSILVKGGQVVPRSVLIFFFSFFFCRVFLGDLWPGSGSGSERLFCCLHSFSIDLHFVTECLNTDPSAQSGTKPQATLAEQAPKSNFDFRKQILIFNSDFRKQTSIFQNELPLSNSQFRKQTPLFKLPFPKTNSHFLRKLRFSNSFF